MRGRFRLCVIGLGRAGKIHFKNIYQSVNAVVKYALDCDEKKLDEFQKYYNDSTIEYLLSKNIDIVLQDEELDGVVICSPTNTHEDIIIRSLMSGKSVFCEKPISSSCEGIEKCYDIAASRNLILHCSMNRRYDPSIGEIYKSLRNNELGRIHVIKTCSRDSPKPSMDYLKISSGIFHDCGVHDLDLLLWLLNKKPKSLYVSSFTEDTQIAAIGDQETAVINIVFEDGTLGVIEMSRQSTYGYDQRVEVHGNKGMLESRNQLKLGYVTSTHNGINNGRLMNSFNDRYSEAYIASLETFLDCMKCKKPSPITKDEIMTVSKLANLCEESNVEQKVVFFNNF